MSGWCGNVRDQALRPHIVRKPRSLESLILCVEMGAGVALLDQNTRLSYDDSGADDSPFPERICGRGSSQRSGGLSPGGAECHEGFAGRHSIIKPSSVRIFGQRTDF